MPSEAPENLGRRRRVAWRRLLLRLRRAGALLSICLTLGGCCFRYSVVGSLPESQDGRGIVRTRASGGDSLDLSFYRPRYPKWLPSWKFESQGISVRIGSENWQEEGITPSYPSVSLGADLQIVWFHIKPSTTSGTTFDPSRVTISTEEARALAPSCVVVGGGRGPSRSTGWLERHRSFTCTDVVPRLDAHLPSGTSYSESELPVVPMSKPTIIWLFFDVPGRPSQRFILEVAGLELNGAQLDLPRLDFARSEYSVRECTFGIND